MALTLDVARASVFRGGRPCLHCLSGEFPVVVSKAKVADAAQKLVAQGKLKEAINEYLKIHRGDPSDQNTLNALGDLSVRANNIPDALSYYGKLADIYVSEGFLVRGIAMYKKISKIDPVNIHALERLADLYTMQGLMSEARAQYMQLADTYLKANRSAQAMEILQKLIDVEPDNLRIQQRLAELYERNGQRKEAAGIYARMAERLLERKQAAECRKWLQKAINLAPDKADVLLLQARLQQHQGESARVLATLEKIRNVGEHPEAVQLLLNARLEAGKTRDAEELGEKLFAADPRNFAALLQLASHAIKQKNAPRGLALLQRIAEPALEQEPFKFLRSAGELNALLPNSPEALDLLARAARAAGDQATLIRALTGQAQTAISLGDLSRAKQVHDELVTLQPEDPDFAYQLRLLRERLGELTAPTEAPTAPAPEARGLNPPPAKPVLDEEAEAYISATLTDIDLFSSYGMTDKAIELAQQLVARMPDHVVGHEKLLDFHLGSGNDAGVVEIARRLEGLYRRVNNEARAEEVASLGRRYAAKIGLAAPAETPAQPPPPAQSWGEPNLHEVDLSAEWDAVSNTEQVAEPPPVEVMGTSEASPASAWAGEEVVQAPAGGFNAAEARVEVDFYIAQGYLNEARALLSRYEENFPGEPVLAELRARVEAAVAPAEAPPLEVAEAPPLEIASLETPAVEQGDTYEVALAEQPSAANPSPSMTADQFFTELTSELDEALAAAAPPAEPLVPPARLEPRPIPMPRPVPLERKEEPLLDALADVFQEFKQEMGDVEEIEDLETHYNLGIAYKEMGLLDEAISEFQKASKAAGRQRSYLQLFQCCTLLGLCFLDKGMPQIAVRWYERALRAPGVDEESALALRYDMGVAHEQAGNRKAALDCFLEVYGTNVDYRNVSERIRELEGA